MTPVKGKAILVSGHDLKDLGTAEADRRQGHQRLHARRDAAGARLSRAEEIQASGRAITAARGRTSGPSSTQFPGAILMTTNCIQKPKESYMDRIFTSGPRGLAGRAHIAGPRLRPGHRGRPGRRRASRKTPRDKTDHSWASGITPCWAWPARSSTRVKSEQIRHFFLVGGCDGAKSGRNYYTEFAQKVPADSSS